MPEIKKLQYKVVLLGDPAVGKTSMVRRFVQDEFDDKYIATLGTKISKKSLTYDQLKKDKIIELDLMVWDVMGQDDYEIFLKSAYSGAQGAMIVSDISRKETIINLLKWQTSLYDTSGEIPVIMIGNKNDLSEQFKNETVELERLVKEIEVPLFLTSAKTGENIEDAFFKMGENILKMVYNIQ